MKKQIHLCFSGRVQGVGFRFTTQDLARDLGVYGWVKNLRDGRVEVVAEGEESVLKEFLAGINQSFSRYIQDVGIQWQEATNDFKDFRIQLF